MLSTKGGVSKGRRINENNDHGDANLNKETKIRRLAALVVAQVLQHPSSVLAHPKYKNSSKFHKGITRRKEKQTDHLLLLDRPGTYTSNTSPRIDNQLWWPDPIAIPICRQCLWWWRRQSRWKYPSVWRNTIHDTIHSILSLPFFPSLINIHRRTSSHNRHRHFCLLLLLLLLYWYLPLSKMHYRLIRQGRPRARHSGSWSCRTHRRCSVRRGSGSSARCACPKFRSSTALRTRCGRPS
jgi:hypothetical protein